MKLISFNASNNKHFYDSLALKENPFYDNPICGVRRELLPFGEEDSRANLHALAAINRDGGISKKKDRAQEEDAFYQ